MHIRLLKYGRTDEVDIANSTLLDASSLVLFMGHGYYSAFTQKPPSIPPIPSLSYEAYFRKLISDAINEQSINEEKYQNDQRCYITALTFLEQYLLHDNVYVDKGSMDSIIDRSQPGESLKEKFSSFACVLKTINIGADCYSQIGSNISGFKAGLDSLGQDSIFNQFVIPDFNAEPYMSLSLKDGIMVNCHSSLGDSNNGVLRSIFYHELSAMTGLSLILHPMKNSILKSLNTALLKDYHSIYKKLTNKVANNLDMEIDEVPIPPLADLIVEFSFKENVSLIEAAAFIHNDDKIKSFRQLISEMVNGCHDGGRIKIKNEICSISTEISKRINEKNGIGIISRKRVHVSKIPGVSSVLKLFDTKPLTVPDIALWERPYITLYNNWVNL